jgi:hypothetical protein
VFDDDTGIVEYGATLDVRQSLHLLDQVLQVQLIEASSPQQRRLPLRPNVEILVIRGPS